MPFGSKPGPDGQVIDFNRVYDELIKPALEAAGLEVIPRGRRGTRRRHPHRHVPGTAHRRPGGGGPHLDNPNVWYELGVRHALRARGVVHRLRRPGRPPPSISTPTASCATASRTAGRTRRRSTATPAPDRNGESDDGIVARPQGQPGLSTCCPPAGAGLEIAAYRRRARVLGASTMPGRIASSWPARQAHRRRAGAGRRSAGRRLSR